ncbi:MAG: hypothetical protein RIG62_31790 [Cyclobacteriaceae bacterium]
MPGTHQPKASESIGDARYTPTGGSQPRRGCLVHAYRGLLLVAMKVKRPLPALASEKVIRMMHELRADTGGEATVVSYTKTSLRVTAVGDHPFMSSSAF